MASSKRSVWVDNRGQRLITTIGRPSSFWADLYTAILTARWPSFFAAALVLYLSVHALFAWLYLLEPGSILNAAPGSFVDAYAFSVQTMMTIGYGLFAPATPYAHALVTIEAFIGMFVTAILTGLVFAKFSRPRANVLFSSSACISRHEGSPALMFRLANARGNRIIEATLSVSYARSTITAEGETFRRVSDLPLMREKNALFSLSWTGIHIIDESSPLYGETRESLEQKAAEIIVVLSGVDDSSVQSVYARKSYVPADLAWGRRFADILRVEPSGERVVDYTRFHDTTEAPR